MCNFDANPSQISADQALLAGLMRATLADGDTFRFSAPGRSMAPFIHHNDVISVAPLEARPVRCGDILAFIAPRDGRLLVHRAVQTSPAAFLCKGDNITVQNDGWVPAEAVLGRVNQVQRGGKQKRLGLGAEKVLIALLSRWGLLVPLLNVLRRVRGAFRR